LLGGAVTTIPGSLGGSSHPVPRARGLAVAIVACLVVFSVPGVSRKERKIPRVVTGVVLDEGDNGIAGASVELKNVQTGKKVAMFTQEDGRYQFSDLRPTEDYEVQASYKGASSEVRKASSLDTRQKIVLNLRISLPKSPGR